MIAAGAPPFIRRRQLALLFAVSLLLHVSPSGEVRLRAEQRAPAHDNQRALDFRRDVKPILHTHCIACHGGVQRAGGFSFVFRSEVTAPADSGQRAIVPGDPAASEIMRRITHPDSDERMPPEGAPLSDAEVAAVRNWIDRGAPYDRHWAYEICQRPLLPEVHGERDCQTPLDRFVRARLAKNNLRAAPEANRSTLLRRVSLDLIGLPPTLREVDAFVADTRPDAYDRVVDRLLASPHFGERWASMWLDFARYADTQGYESDAYREIWRYRDWVIDAFNGDLPYDRFTIMQLAGDLLPSPSTEQQLATAFHRNTLTNVEGGSDDEQFRVAAVIDRVNTSWEVWMATTFGCAQCHSHPYDPFLQEEYYRCLALFNNTADSDKNDDQPRLETPSPRQQQRLNALRAALAAAQRQLAALPAGILAAGGEPATPGDREGAAGAEIDVTSGDPQRDAALERVEQLKRQLAEAPVATTPVMRELAAEDRRSTRFFLRGDWLNPGDEVTGGVPASLLSPSAGPVQNRLQLAVWMVSPQHPLTSRVAANRLWAELFGAGLVATLEDFGTPSPRPSHPLLLDYLAWRFVHCDEWSVKRFLRELVLSATYRQSSRRDAEATQVDPGNRLLWRGPRFRLSAEQVRDQALYVSGLLSTKLHGPSVFPPRPAEATSSFGGDKWSPSQGEDRYRRGLYTYVWRTSPYPAAISFDAPTREFCVSRRIRTNTPLQALTLLNDTAFVEAAEALGRELQARGASDVRSCVLQGFRAVLARDPKRTELDQLVLLHDSALGQLQQATTSAAGDNPPRSPQDLAMTVVAHVLLNLDETVTKN